MRIIRLVTLAFIAIGIILSGTGINAQGTPASKAAIEQGQKVYVANKCSTCHLIDGKGAKKGPLDGVGSKLTEAEIREWIVNAPEMTKKTKATRKPVMKTYKHLPKEDVDALVAYMVSLKKA